MTFTFENVPPKALSRLIETAQDHGVSFTIVSSVTNGPELRYARGQFRSLSGDGQFTFYVNRLSVTILRDAGHFSKLMIKGGLKQLVSEACELSDRLRDPVQQQHADADAEQNAGV